MKGTTNDKDNTDFITPRLSWGPEVDRGGVPLHQDPNLLPQHAHVLYHHQPFVSLTIQITVQISVSGQFH